MHTTAPTTADTEIRDVLDRLYAAWADGDAGSFSALYTEDATVAMPGVFHQGRDAVRAFMGAAFAGPLAGSRGVEEIREIRVRGDAAIVSGVAGILMAGETALPTDRERLSTWVLTRDDGGWRIAAYTNTPAH